MKNDLIDNPTIINIKSCKTCEHRTVMGECVRVGLYCDTEMRYRGMCNQDGDLKLWTQRLGVFPRISRFFFGG